jgi:hypothetical protein
MENLHALFAVRQQLVEELLDLSDAFDVDVDAIAFVDRMEILGAASMRLRELSHRCCSSLQSLNQM